MRVVCHYLPKDQNLTTYSHFKTLQEGNKMQKNADTQRPQ